MSERHQKQEAAVQRYLPLHEVLTGEVSSNTKLHSLVISLSAVSDTLHGQYPSSGEEPTCVPKSRLTADSCADPGRACASRRCSIFVCSQWKKLSVKLSGSAPMLWFHDCNIVLEEPDLLATHLTKRLQVARNWRTQKVSLKLVTEFVLVTRCQRRYHEKTSEPSKMRTLKLPIMPTMPRRN